MWSQSPPYPLCKAFFGIPLLSPLPLQTPYQGQHGPGKVSQLTLHPCPNHQAVPGLHSSQWLPPLHKAPPQGSSLSLMTLHDFCLLFASDIIFPPLSSSLSTLTFSLALGQACSSLMAPAVPSAWRAFHPGSLILFLDSSSLSPTLYHTFPLSPYHLLKYCNTGSLDLVFTCYLPCQNQVPCAFLDR